MPRRRDLLPGQIEGKTYGKTGGCVPESRATTFLVPDGGFDLRPDGLGSAMPEAGGDRPADTTPADTAPTDSGETDAGADAPAEAGV